LASPPKYYQLAETLLGLGLLAFAAWRKLRTRRWPIAEGTIESSGFTEVPDGNGISRTALVVSYSYQVNGTFYGATQESRFWAGTPYRDLVGRKVQVRYKPGQPETSELVSVAAGQTPGPKYHKP
jgi:hypothetical protein